MADTSHLGKLVPGFDFLESLVKSASSALPGMVPGIGQWVAPTLSPEELEKRINELRTVQFWLEQNARVLSTTIQALEVQRMTLSTLKTMNVQMEDLRDALQIKLPIPPTTAPSPSSSAQRAAPEPKAAHSEAEDEAAQSEADGETPRPAAVDPMQWWGALTKQFTDLATSAMKDTGAEAARGMADALFKQGLNAAAQAMGTPEAAAPDAAEPPSTSAASSKPRTRASTRAAKPTEAPEAPSAPAAATTRKPRSKS